jgi:hypothetical protein
MAPDFIELGGGQVQFPLAFFTTGDVAKFYVGYGLVKEGDAAITINNVISANTTMGSLQIPTGFTLDKPYMEIPLGSTVSGAGNVSTDKAITGAGILATTGTVLSRGVAPTQPVYDTVVINGYGQVDTLKGKTADNGVQLEGRANGVAIEAGKVGEVKTGVILDTLLSSGVAKTVGTIALTKGIWIAYGCAYVDAGTAVSLYRSSINNVTDTLNSFYLTVLYGLSGTDYCLPAPTRVFNVSTGTNIFLVVAISGTGAINCRASTFSNFYAVRIA